jgi:hypothetical protein
VFTQMKVIACWSRYLLWNPKKASTPSRNKSKRPSIRNTYCCNQKR